MRQRLLTDICDILYGYPFDSSGFTSSPDDAHPLIRIRDVKEGRTETYYRGNYPREYIVHRGDYLIGMDGEFNIAPWKSEDALLNQRVCKISSSQPNVLMGFIYRFLKKELKRIEDETPFVTVKHLSAKRLNRVHVNVPALPEQEMIVAELDCLTGIIEKKKQQLKELDNLAQTIFYDMFGDPTTNEKGWEKSTIGDTCVITCGQDYKSVADENGPYPIYGTGGIMGRASQFRCPKDTVIIGRKGNINNPIYVAEPFWNVDTAFGVTPNSLKLNPKFFYFFCLDYDFTQHDVSVTIPSLRRTDILKIKVPTPPIDLQNAFAQKIEAIEKQKELIKKSIQETETLFNSRMDYWFN